MGQRWPLTGPQHTRMSWDNSEVGVVRMGVFLETRSRLQARDDGKKIKRGDLLKIILTDVSHAISLISASLKSQVLTASREDLNVCTWLLF